MTRAEHWVLYEREEKAEYGVEVPELVLVAASGYARREHQAPLPLQKLELGGQ